MTETEASAVKPRPAATVLLVRDRPDGRLEVFMEKRHLSSTFVGGAYVFPGGRVDQADSHSAEFTSSLDDREASKRLTLDGGGLAYYVAALRECFEEAGVLLATTNDGSLLDFSEPATEDRYRTARDRLNAGKITFQRLLSDNDLRLATDRMVYWSHWITPVGEKRRYDTRFFIARAPENQVATHDDWELTSSTWVEPGTALDKALAKEWLIIFPTLHTLKALEQMGTAERALAWAGGDHHRPINQPKIYDGRPVLPGDEGYAEAEEDIRGSDPALWISSFRR